jgi:hypothetical protein
MRSKIGGGGGEGLEPESEQSPPFKTQNLMVTVYRSTIFASGERQIDK